MLLEVAAELAGVRAPCPGCREEITAPLVSEPKPRPLRPRRDRSTAEPEQGINSPPPPVASPGHPPSSPPRAVASPPLPKSPPEGSEAQFEARPRRAEAEPVRRGARSKPGRSINPITALSEKYQDRKETLAILKVVTAVVITIGIALAVVALTKRSVARSTYESREQGRNPPIKQAVF